jgi:DNA polymerase III alpha subunit (gram-positive type)
MKNYNKLLIYDLETNGFYKEDGSTQPLEIAIIAVTPYKIMIYNKLFKPPQPIPRFITEINGITNDMVNEDANNWNAELHTLNNLLNNNDYLVIGHNHIKFDNRFINQLFDKYTNCDIKYSYMNESNCFDTGGEFKSELMGISKLELDDFGTFHNDIVSRMVKGVKWNLETAAIHYEIPIPEIRHRALADVKLTGSVFVKQIEKYLNNHITINLHTLENLKSIL